MSFGWYDVVGIIGVIAILVAYLLLQINRIDSNSLQYSVLNAAGALFIIISLFYQFNLSAFIIEISWLFISILGLIRYFKNKHVK